MECRYYNLSELLIERRKDDYRVFDTSGGEHILNKQAIITLLCASGQYEQADVFTKAKNYINLQKVTDIDEILNKFRTMGLLSLSDRPYEPFSSQIVLDNVLAEQNLIALNISSITISPSKLCAYRCEGCYSDSGPNASEESALDKQLEALKDARKLGATICAIGGGEPTHPKVIEKTFAIIDSARNLGYQNVTLLSSGYDIAKHISQLMKGVTQVELSLDGLEEYHNKYRNHPQAFKRAIDAAQACKANNLPFDINTVIVRENVDQLEDLINLCIELGANSINLMPVLCVGRAKANRLKLAPTEIRDVNNKIKSIVGKYENKISMKFSDEKVTGPMACRAGISTAYVAENGIVYACNNLLDEPAGNLSNESFTHIWSFSPKFEELRNKRNMNAQCYECGDRDYCIGKCRAIMKSVFGTTDFTKSLPCPFENGN